MRVCITGYAGAEDKGHWEAGFRKVSWARRQAG